MFAEWTMRHSPPLMPGGGRPTAKGRGAAAGSPRTSPWPSRRRDCHFADALSPSLLMHLLKGVHQNDSLVNGYLGRRISRPDPAGGSPRSGRGRHDDSRCGSRSLVS